MIRILSTLLTAPSLSVSEYRIIKNGRVALPLNESGIADECLENARKV